MSNQGIQPASPEQIEVFFKAAESRFTEMGLNPEQSKQAMGAFLNNQASELGISLTGEPPAKQASAEEETFLKAAHARFAELNFTPAEADLMLNKLAADQPSEKVVKIANQIKAQLGR